MHEYSTTLAIVEKVIDEAHKRNAKRVICLELKIGKLTLLSVEQVKFCFEAISKGTMLEGCELVIEQTPPVFKCESCGRIENINIDALLYDHTAPSIPSFVCPSCGNRLEIVGGKECIIKGMRIVV